MKNIWTIAIAIAAAGLALMLASCSGGGGLGAEQSAGPFKVTLSTSPNPPTPGVTNLVVNVTKGGTPVQDATVKIDSSMPGMNMPGPSVSLERSGDAYAGSMNMMEGKWEMKVHMTQGSDQGSSTFAFDVR